MLTRFRLWLARLVLPSGWCVVVGVRVGPITSETPDGNRWIAGVATRSVAAGEFVGVMARGAGTWRETGDGLVLDPVPSKPYWIGDTDA